MCAAPRAPPPESARPMSGREETCTSAATLGRGTKTQTTPQKAESRTRALRRMGRRQDMGEPFERGAVTRRRVIWRRRHSGVKAARGRDYSRLCGAFWGDRGLVVGGATAGCRYGWGVLVIPRRGDPRSPVGGSDAPCSRTDRDRQGRGRMDRPIRPAGLRIDSPLPLWVTARGSQSLEGAVG